MQLHGKGITLGIEVNPQRHRGRRRLGSKGITLGIEVNPQRHGTQ